MIKVRLLRLSGYAQYIEKKIESSLKCCQGGTSCERGKGDYPIQLKHPLRLFNFFPQHICSFYMYTHDTEFLRYSTSSKENHERVENEFASFKTYSKKKQITLYQCSFLT